MKKRILLVLLLIVSYTLFANDGAFFAQGNQLIPINETDISVRKEILTLKKISNKFIEVTVYYEFFNPGAAKTITVGFEASSPSGDVEGAPKKGQHPYMRDFTVELNGAILQYNIAYVTDLQYNKNGRIESINLATLNDDEKSNAISYYVYHFEANFKKGLNIIKHTYNYDVSNGVMYNYEIPYVLTAANRWANKQIDDFTLIIDCGEFETFCIHKNFFKNSDEWIINGIGKVENVVGNVESLVTADALKFHIHKGSLIFQKKNFRPVGDLFLCTLNYNYIGVGQNKLDYLPFSYYQEGFYEPKNDMEKKILKNLPFARRGYIFQNKELNDFYKRMDWYIPNPNYVPEVEALTDIEKKWLERWK